ncbi:integrating conjugative element protein [Serratia microhaemolytica]|uniref:integrating conjugative element protein n=1 Tax=Serratia microhaemolytica TaxID=2675110 RepID=UPI000FDD9F39|nr:integrating conjugative element protein [Serratia microhaemolytica]
MKISQMFVVATFALSSLSSWAALPILSSQMSGNSTGAAVTGAVSDRLFYTLGGGSVISQPPTRSQMQKLGFNIGWRSNLMCGNFDLKTTVGNQLNGMTAGFKNLMGEVIQGATGAVASLPAMLIQRANPGLYEMLTNGMLQANVAFDKAQLNCESMAKKMADFTTNDWSQQAMFSEYTSIVNNGGGDAVRSDEAGRKVTGTGGSPWIGGQQRGGAGQPAIRPTHDLVAAGFNMMNGLPVTSTQAVSGSQCNGSVCQKFSRAEEAAQAVVKVLGDKTQRTCSDATKCTSGSSDDQAGTVAGTGFSPMLEETTKSNSEQLVKLVNGAVPLSVEELAKLKSGGLPITANVITALKRDPDNATLVARLASELAMAETIETALLMRRMLITGMAEPNASNQKAAMEEAQRRIDALDRELTALKNEMEIRRALANNSALTIIERENQRIATHPQTQIDDDTDSRVNQLENQ